MTSQTIWHHFQRNRSIFQFLTHVELSRSMAVILEMPQYVTYQKTVVYAFIKLSAKSHSFNILCTMDGLSCLLIGWFIFGQLDRKSLLYQRIQYWLNWMLLYKLSFCMKTIFFITSMRITLRKLVFVSLYGILKGTNGRQKTYEIFYVYCIFYSGFMCQTTVIFGITKDGSLVLNTLASWNCFTCRNLFQNGANDMSECLTLVLLRVFPEHIFLRGGCCNPPFGLSILKVI